MKNKKINNLSTSRSKNKTPNDFKKTLNFGEKARDSVPLTQDIYEEYREPLSNELSSSRKNSANWSEPEDRGEDLINERDPFIQQPERDTEIPPELIQKRAYLLYEQRVACGKNPNNLADWFEAERQLRGEISNLSESSN